MKKKIPIIVLLALVTLFVRAQEEVKVDYEGSRPNITDFVDAILSFEELDESLNLMAREWELYKAGGPTMENVTFTVDKRNGYMRFEMKGEENDLSYIEVSFWNCIGSKRKFVVLNNGYEQNGMPILTQYSGLVVYSYTNSTRGLRYTTLEDAGAWVEMPINCTVSFSLPRQGKNIDVFYDMTDGNRMRKVLMWNGRKFELVNP